TSPTLGPSSFPYAQHAVAWYPVMRPIPPTAWEQPISPIPQPLSSIPSDISYHHYLSSLSSPYTNGNGMIALPYVGGFGGSGMIGMGMGGGVGGIIPVTSVSPSVLNNHNLHNDPVVSSPYPRQPARSTRR